MKTTRSPRPTSASVRLSSSAPPKEHRLQLWRAIESIACAFQSRRSERPVRTPSQTSTARSCRREQPARGGRVGCLLIGRARLGVHGPAEFAERHIQGVGDASHGRPGRVRGPALDPSVRGDRQPGRVREVLLCLAALLAQVQEGLGEIGVGSRWSRHAPGTLLATASLVQRASYQVVQPRCELPYPVRSATTAHPTWVRPQTMTAMRKHLRSQAEQ